jgi:hypothetical protein
MILLVASYLSYAFVLADQMGEQPSHFRRNDSYFPSAQDMIVEYTVNWFRIGSRERTFEYMDDGRIASAPNFERAFSAGFLLLSHIGIGNQWS